MISRNEFLKGFLSTWSKYMAVVFIMIFIAFCSIYLAGGRYNTTPSYPKGLYWVVDKKPEKGDLVTFCPENDALSREAFKRQYLTVGYCDGGFGELIKRVYALEGDVVTATLNDIRVNGEIIPNTKNMLFDKYGREMPAFTALNYKLSEGEVLLLSEFNAQSYDGRYYGTQSIYQITDVIRPIVTE